jgi:hypothetical protein
MAEPANHPGADDVGLQCDLMEDRVVQGIVPQLAPEGGNPDHHRAAAVFRVALEEVDQSAALLEGVLPTIVEPDAPDGHNRLPSVVEVGLIARIPCQAHAVHKCLEVLDDPLGAPSGEPGEVVHEGIRAPMIVGGGAAVGEDLGELLEALRVGHLSGEALDEGAVDAVLRHPLEVPVHRPGDLGAVDLGHAAIGVAELGVEALILAQFRHVRPQVDGARTGPEAVSAVVVVPTSV